VYRFVFLFILFFYVLIPRCFCACADLDGDGIAETCISGGGSSSVPETTPSYPSSSTQYNSRSEPARSAPVKKAYRPAVPSTESMAQAAFTGAIFSSMLDAVFSSPSVPAGPTPEQIEAQRLLEEQKRQEFLRANEDLAGKLKGFGAGNDKDKVSAGSLKLKMPSTGAHKDFFGSQTSSALTDEVLNNPVWIDGQKDLIVQRIKEPNKWSGSIYASLKTKAPPLPYKKFDELEPGDVLLIYPDGFNKAITLIDNLVSDSESLASHTVIFLREVDGVKHFMENVPGKGPHIITESQVIAEYGARGADVARLAQPLNEHEAKKLYSAALEMAAANRKDVKGSFFSDTTNYGAWGKDNVVCSEADWALLNLARPGASVPKTDDKIKSAAGVDFSPADFYDNDQYFLVSPLLDMPEK